MNNAQTAIIIKSLCKNKEIPISKLLLDCNIRKSLMYDMEKRNYTPSAEVLEKIADYFYCSVDYLLGRTDVPEVNRSAKVISIAEQFENADNAKVAAYGEGTHTITDDK